MKRNGTACSWSIIIDLLFYGLVPSLSWHTYRSASVLYRKWQEKQRAKRGVVVFSFSPIHGGGRLIHHKDARLTEQRTGQADHLLLALQRTNHQIKRQIKRQPNAVSQAINAVRRMAAHRRESQAAESILAVTLSQFGRGLLYIGNSAERHFDERSSHVIAVIRMEIAIGAIVFRSCEGRVRGSSGSRRRRAARRCGHVDHGQKRQTENRERPLRRQSTCEKSLDS